MLRLRSLARECCQGVKAPVGNEVTQPDVLTISDECLGKVRGPGEKGKTNILSLLSRQVLDQRFGLVHCPSRPDGRERPGDPLRSALRHVRRDRAPPARSSADSMRASTRASPLPSCACHSPMKACQLSVSAKIGRDHVVVLRKFRNLITPCITCFGKTMQ